jgi:hypothetical protein
MWLVKLGLRRPYTLAVVAILLAVLGSLTIQRTPTDVLRGSSTRASRATDSTIRFSANAARARRVIWTRVASTLRTARAWVPWWPEAPVGRSRLLEFSRRVPESALPRKRH